MEDIRTQEILDAVEGILESHDRWAADRHSNQHIPPDAFDDEVSYLSYVLTVERIPEALTLLVERSLNFCMNWDRYLNGEEEFITRDKRPMTSAWGQFNEMREIHRRCTAKVIIQTESVSAMLAEGVQPEQIAKSFGKRNEDGEWSGPFFTDGKPRRDAVLAQAAFEKGEPGGKQVLPSGYNRVEMNNRPEPADDSNLPEHIAELKARTSRNNPQQEQPARDKGTPEELALGGAFPHQVKNAFGLTDDEVAAVFDRIDPDKNGKPPEVLDVTTPGIEPPTDQPEAVTSAEDAVSESAVTLADPDSMDSQQLAELVSAIRDGNPELSAAGIAGENRAKTGIAVDGRSVMLALRKLEQQGATTT